MENEPASGPDYLTGSSDNDNINGLAGDDSIYGYGGSDVLAGNTGAWRSRLAEPLTSAFAGSLDG